MDYSVAERKTTMKRLGSIGMGIGLACVGIARAAEAPPAGNPPPPPDTTLRTTTAITGQLDISLVNEARAIQNRGLKWLAKRQQADGSWSLADFPALTALPLWAFAVSDYPDKARIVSNAVQSILKNAQPDGSIYKKAPGPGGGLVNYNTALCMTALHMTRDPSLAPVVLKARRFMAAAQHLEGDDMYKGGFGYDKASGRQYTDLSDSVIAYEAMRLTQGAEDLRPADEKRVDVNWGAATQFLGRVQNTEQAGTNDAGGFVYRPDESKAGKTTNTAGVVVLRSYGSMTYAGLLSLIYADVSRNDPRVRAAFDWAANHWSLSENPGMGPEGLYYFYNIMAKSLSAFGMEGVPAKAGGKPVAWRSEMIAKLISLQKVEPDGSGEGYWVNSNNRWMENDPVLVTAYTLIALDVAMAPAK
jgi:squalene-hopene/tetraprenyl-beta-curcumene cyclase